MNKEYVYVASSWRNHRQTGVVCALRAAGLGVYDFKNPEPGDRGFHWSEIDPDWKSWGPRQFIEALSHPIAVSGFDKDKAALDRATAGVLVMPCGRSAHLELGYLVGRGVPTAILATEGEPELMYRLASTVVFDFNDLLEWAETLSRDRAEVVDLARRCPHCGGPCEPLDNSLMRGRCLQCGGVVTLQA